MQIREDLLTFYRPTCPHNCSGIMHGHGTYKRYARPEDDDLEKIVRFYCRPCGHTVSILPRNRLTYRPVHVDRLEAHLNFQAKLSDRGPVPAPSKIEAGCLHRACTCLVSRIAVLKSVFGQLLSTGINCASELWLAMRQAKVSLVGILDFLAQTHQISLLANYRCLRPAGAQLSAI